MHGTPRRGTRNHERLRQPGTARLRDHGTAPGPCQRPARPGTAATRSPLGPRGRETGRLASPNAAPDVRRYALRALPDTPGMCRAMTRLDAKLWGIADPGDLETVQSGGIG